MALTDQERAVLNFENGPHWTYPGVKEDAIRAQLDMTPTRYYQLLNALLDRPEALVEFPMLIKRLQRVRDRRRGAWVTVQQ